MIWVAAAGPGINLVMAMAAALAMPAAALLPDVVSPWVLANLRNALVLNVVLAVFNMLPLPPLDGGRVMVGLLPRDLAVRYARIERFGMPLLLALIVLPPLIGEQLGVDLGILRWVLLPPVQFVIDAIGYLAW